MIGVSGKGSAQLGQGGIEKQYIYGIQNVMFPWEWYVGSSYRFDPNNVMAKDHRIKEHLKDSYSMKDGKFKNGHPLYKAFRRQVKILFPNEEVDIVLRSVHHVVGEYKLSDIKFKVFTLEGPIDCKYGVDGQYTEESLNHLNSRENYWINFYDCLTMGYNTATASRPRVSKGKNHYTRRKGSPFKGKSHSPKARHLISLSALGRPCPHKGKPNLNSTIDNKRTWKIPEVRQKRIDGIKKALKGLMTNGLNPRAVSVNITNLDGSVVKFATKKESAVYLNVSGTMLNRYIKEGLKPKRMKAQPFAKIEIVGRTKELINETK